MGEIEVGAVAIVTESVDGAGVGAVATADAVVTAA